MADSQSSQIDRSIDAEPVSVAAEYGGDGLVRAIIEGIPTPVAFLDSSFTLIAVNTAFMTAFGHGASTLIGSDCFSHIPEPEAGAIFNRVRANRQAESFHDRPIMFPDQPERGVTYWDWTLTPVIAGSDLLSSFILSLIETTQRVRATNVLQLATEELEGSVKQRTAALQRVNIDLAAEIQRRTIAEEELRALSRRLVQLQEDERHHISRELHDEVGQNLTMLKMMLDMAARRPGVVDPQAAKSASEQVSRVIAQVRNISMALHPSTLEVLGIEPALKALFERLLAQTGLRVEFRSSIDNELLDKETRLTVYRIVQEALTNVLRYAGVKSACVTLTDTGTGIALSITDDGRGFDYTALSTGQSNGISGMRERVYTLAGSFRLETGVGRGTSIDVELPYQTPQSG